MLLAMKQQNNLYTCPMHPQVIQDHPGNCPICGMALSLKTASENPEPNPELIDMSRRFWVSVVLTGILLVLTMGSPIFTGHIISPHFSAWLQWALATPVVFWGGWPFFQRAGSSIVKRHLNMFTLIALGIGIAYFYSFFVLLFPNLLPAVFRTNGVADLYFEAAAVITTLILMGQILELRGRERSGNAIRALLHLAPKKATRIRSDDSEEEISLEDVHVGDRLHIRPGEKIPVDGIVTKGNSTVDESMITGEFMPVEKQLNAQVIGGTLNLSGSFIMRAERVGSDTLLAQIVHLVSEAQYSRAPIQRLADNVSGYFVPAVIIIAVITFFIWLLIGPTPAFTYGLIAAISVLIIACPCALGLATPMSIIVGIGRGAHAGIIIKNAENLERFEKVDTLIVDKTGTLTAGKPIITNIIPFDDFTEEKILLLAASLEHHSEHPLANAIVTAAKERGLLLQEVSEFTTETGQGIKGIIQGNPVVLGNMQLVESLAITPSEAIKKSADQLRQDGATVMFVVVDRRIAGLIGVNDAIKPSTPTALNLLKKAGIRIIMVTGDNRVTAEAIAKKLGITEIKAEILPNQKNEIIKELKKQGHIVAMAGDGINDAPALAEADVGIAMGTGTDIAIQSAGITLVKGDLMGIVSARELSKTVMRNIRQNLFLAFIYNLLCIPIAAGVLYPWTGLLLSPMIAAAAMSLSSVSVVANAWRLRRK